MELFYIVLCLLVSNSQCLDLSNILCSVEDPVAFYKVTDTEKTEVTNSTTFDRTKTTYFVIHGIRSTSDEPGLRNLADDLYLKTGGNVIMIDFNMLSYKEYITCAHYMVYTVGDIATDFILNQTKAGNMHPSNIYFIAHSLGSHVSGYVGKQLQKNNFTLKRISALDPAGPLFSIKISPDIRLSADDAEMVDALHTSVLLGTIDLVGKVDVFANGPLGIPVFIKPCTLRDELSFCTHIIGKAFYQESIHSCGIVAQNESESGDNLIYGFHMDMSSHGVFNFIPNEDSPYGSTNPDCANN